MLLVILSVKKFLKGFAKKNSKKQIKSVQSLKRRKKIKRKDDEVYVKWKGYDSSFNSWINKKDKV